MMKLADFRPTEAENEATGDMPEQVAIGWIRAKRRADMARSAARNSFKSFTPPGIHE